MADTPATTDELVELMARAIGSVYDGYAGPAVATSAAEDVLQALSEAGYVVVPKEPTYDMLERGLIGLVEQIVRLSGEMPPLSAAQLEGREPIPAPEAAQRYMHIGATMRCGSEVEAAYRAMINAS
jgi:hypothetical protein